MMMIPIKTANVSESFVRRLTMRAVQMQGFPEVHYGSFDAATRERWEANARTMIAALESLGCSVLAPADLSPTLPHDREDPHG